MFRILIAEDDPSTARLLCAIVKRAGYEPLIAADGVQALELLGPQPDRPAALRCDDAPDGWLYPRPEPSGKAAACRPF